MAYIVVSDAGIRDDLIEKRICRLAKAYCLRKATVATHFCGVQHNEPPSMRQLFAVVTSWHPQLMHHSVSWYTQAVVAQYMVKAYCGGLDSVCTTCRITVVLFLVQLSGSESHHRFKNVSDEQEIFVSLNLHMLVSQSCRSADRKCDNCSDGYKPVNPCRQ